MDGKEIIQRLNKIIKLIDNNDIKQAKLNIDDIYMYKSNVL